MELLRSASLVLEGTSKRNSKWSRYKTKTRTNPFRWVWSVMTRAIMQCHAISSSFKVACFFTLIAGGIKLLEAYSADNFLKYISQHEGEAYKVISSFISILVVFHGVQSYNRFMSGITLAYQMYADFLDTASFLVAFVKVSKAGVTVKNEFLHTAVRLFSMLLMSCLAELETRPEEANLQNELKDLKAHKFDMIDPEGLDTELLHQLQDVEDMPLMINHKILHLMMQGTANGILDSPPPILSRAFQELGVGMTRYHECLKFKDVPFPHTYVTLADILLVIHSLLTPFVSVQWTKSAFGACFYTFIICFFTWSLHIIAEELDNPFGNDDLDMDTHHLMDSFNRAMLALLHDALDSTLPKLATNALNLKTKMKKGEAIPDSHTTTFWELTNLLYQRASASASGLSVRSRHSRKLREAPLDKKDQAGLVSEGEDVEMGKNATSDQPNPNSAAALTGEHTTNLLSGKNAKNNIDLITFNTGQQELKDRTPTVGGMCTTDFAEPISPMSIGNTGHHANHPTLEQMRRQISHALDPPTQAVSPTSERHRCEQASGVNAKTSAVSGWDFGASDCGGLMVRLSEKIEIDHDGNTPIAVEAPKLNKYMAGASSSSYQ